MDAIQNEQPNRMRVLRYLGLADEVHMMEWMCYSHFLIGAPSVVA